MKYLALIYHKPNALNEYKQEDIDALIARHVALQEELRADGTFVVADKLEPVTAAKTLTQENGQLLITDGPFAETKEVLTGYYLLECDNMEHAMRLAAKIPYIRSTKIEVRPVNFHVE